MPLLVLSRSAWPHNRQDANINNISSKSEPKYSILRYTTYALIMSLITNTLFCMLTKDFKLETLNPPTPIICSHR